MNLKLMADSLKVILIQDYAGNSLLSYLSSDTHTNPNLISGLISALNSFNREVIGGRLKEIESTNGLKLRIDSFYINKELYKKHLIYDSELKPETRLFPQKIKGELTGNYFLSNTVNEEMQNEVYFSKIINSLSLNQRVMYFIDFKTRKVKYTLKYTPEYQFKASNKGLKQN